MDPNQPDSISGFDDTGPQDSQESPQDYTDWQMECKNYLRTANLEDIQRGIDSAFARAFTPPGHSPKVTL